MALQKILSKPSVCCGDEVRKVFNNTTPNDDLSQARYRCTGCGEVLTERKENENRPIPKIQVQSEEDKQEYLRFYKENQHLF